MEIWKGVVGYEQDYQVSNMGRVRSLKTSIGLRRPKCEYRNLTLQETEDGYQRAILNIKGRQIHKSVQVLVLRAFVGKCPTGTKGRYRDGNRLNNSLDNLYWDEDYADKEAIH